MVTTGQGGFVVSGKSIVCKTDVLLPLLVVPGAGVENIGLSEISLNGKMANFAAKYAELH